MSNVQTTTTDVEARMAAVLAEEAAAHKHWQETTIATTIGGTAYTIADLQAVFNRVANADDWKAPWAAAVPARLVALVSAAVEWFHADKPQTVGLEPRTGRVLMRGRGYQAW